MRCSELAPRSRRLLPPPPCHHHAGVAPAPPVAELGVVRRFCASREMKHPLRRIAESGSGKSGDEPDLGQTRKANGNDCFEYGEIPGRAPGSLWTFPPRAAAICLAREWVGRANIIPREKEVLGLKFALDMRHNGV